jgi:hypothetical protein
VTIGWKGRDNWLEGKRKQLYSLLIELAVLSTQTFMVLAMRRKTDRSFSLLYPCWIIHCYCGCHSSHQERRGAIFTILGWRRGGSKKALLWHSGLICPSSFIWCSAKHTDWRTRSKHDSRIMHVSKHGKQTNNTYIPQKLQIETQQKKVAQRWP